MTNKWDLVETKIKIENRFRIDVTDYINKMYKTRKNSILPYDINIEDVFEMLQDLTWTTDDRFVVFFNFEFVMCLMKLKVTPDRITYIAPSKESFYEVRDGGWGQRGMKSILFDLDIYKRYQSRKQWKKHLMKKIGKLDEFIAVGNIPFTIKNENSEKGMIKVGNDFIKLMNKFQKSCYILQAKYDSNVFKNEIILNKNLKKIVNHTKKVFDINAGIKTCHVILDKSHTSENFEYQINTSDKIILLDKNENLYLADKLGMVGYVDTTKKTLGDFWNRGNKYLNQLSGHGKYEVITALGSYKTHSFETSFDNEESTGIGKWKVIIPNKGGGRAVKVAGPEYSICFSVVAFFTDSEESAINLHKYIIDSNIMEKSWRLATSSTNTKNLFSRFEIPDGII
jgi:hypothetical protein